MTEPQVAPAPPVPQERFAFIHILRGVAAIIVVWSHLSGFWLLTNGKVSFLQDLWYQFVARPFHVFQNGGHLGVILFFLISGYIITHTSLRETVRTFTIRRVLRIFPPLIVATIVAFLLWLVARASGTDLIGINGGSVWHWLSGGVLLDGFSPEGRVIDVTWTLVVEILFYAITLALLVLSRSRAVLATWIMIGAWAALWVLSLNFGGSIGANTAPTLYLGFLVLGRIIYLWQRGSFGHLDGAIAASLVAVLYLVFAETAEPGFLLAPGGWVGLEPVVTYAYALIIFLAFLRLAPKRAVQPFAFLGDISYSLYLLHLPVGITVLNLLDLAGVPETVNTVIAIVVSVAVSWVSYRFVERPTQSLARRLTRKRGVQPSS